MKSLWTRIVLILVVLAVAAAVLPAFADSWSEPDPVSCSYPWWEINPPVVTKTRVVVRQAETLVESTPAEGWCYTAIKKVNVRSQPSIYATRVTSIRSAGTEFFVTARVTSIRSAGTEFFVTARVKNSSGEIWYAVQLANGTLGYIRSDLLNTDHVILLGDPYAYEADVSTRIAAASESASEAINIASPAAAPAPTPQVIYIVTEPSDQPTPTPIVVYMTPEPPAAHPEVTPQVIYINP